MIKLSNTRSRVGKLPALSFFIFVAALCIALPALAQQQKSSTPLKPSTLSDIPQTKNKPGISASYSRLPFLFEANTGQADARAKFIVRRPGYSVFLTNMGLVSVLQGLHPPTEPDGHDKLNWRTDSKPPKAMALHMQFVGSQSSGLDGIDPSQVSASYYIGSDKNNWRRDIPMFGGVKYASLYPNIDMYVANGGSRLSYHFSVGPKGNPARIRMRFTGTRDVKVDSDGRLILTLPNGGTVIHRPPRTFEYSGTQSREISSAFELVAQDTVGFKIDKYRRGATLVIDPEIDFGTYFGGPGNDANFIGVHRLNGLQLPLADIDTDQQNRLLVGASVMSADLPNAAGPISPTYKLAVGARLNPDATGGPAWEYVTYIGGDEDNQIHGITAGSNGRAFLCGSTTSTNFPLFGTPFDDRNNADFSQGIIVRLDRDGQPDASTIISPGDSTVIQGCDFNHTMGTGRNGHVYVVGHSLNNTGTGIDAKYFQANAVQNTFGSIEYSDGFVIAVDENLSTLKYATLLGGKFEDSVMDVKVRNGEAFITGLAESYDFPLTPDRAADFTLSGEEAEQCGDWIHSYKCFEGFAARLKEDGTELIYSTTLGDSGVDPGYAIDVDRTASAYISGRTFMGPSGSRAFLRKLKPSGNFAYRSIYADVDAVGYDVEVDAHGNAYTTGEIRFDLQAVGNALSTTFQGGERDGFFAVHDSTGQLVYLTYMGGEATDRGLALARDRTGCAFVAMETWSDNLNLPLTIAPQANRSGESDMLLVRHCYPFDYDLLVLRKTVPPFFVDPGQTLQFEITIENSEIPMPGPVVITDRLPLPFQAVSVSGPGCGISGRDVTCTLPEIPLGVSGITIQATNRFACPQDEYETDITEISNTAKFSFPGGVERSTSTLMTYRGCRIERPPPPLVADEPCSSSSQCAEGLVCFKACTDSFTCLIRIGSFCFGRNEQHTSLPAVCKSDPELFGCSRILD